MNIKPSKRLSLLSIFLCSFVFIPSAWAVSYTVNTTNDVADGVCDSNHCSLREAIMAVNRDIMNGGNANCTGNDEIRFNIPVSEATNGAVQYYSIKPTTPLPAVRCKVNLDGYTQPGAVVGSPIIELSGEGLAVTYQQAADYPVSPPSANSSGMPSGLVLVGRDRSKDLTAPHESQDGACETGNAAGCKLARNPDGSTVRGLVINKFPRHAIYLFGVDEAAIIGNFIGVDVTGQLSGYANGRGEVKPRTVGGTLITGADEILIEGSSNNYIGTTQADYNASTINGVNRNVLGSCGRGCIVLIQLGENVNNFAQCSSNPFPAGCDRQAVYNNANVLIHEGITSDNNVIQGNYVGLNKEGTTSIGGFCLSSQTPTSGDPTCTTTNAVYSVRGSALYTGTPDFTFDLVQSQIRAEHAPNQNNLWGGSKPGMGNVVASVRGIGAMLLECGPKSKIIGNIIGLNKNEEIANIPKTGGNSIVLLSGVWGSTIENNVLANSNGAAGVAFLSLRILPGPYDNVVRNNYIGTNRSENLVAGGSAGVYLIGDSHSNSIEKNVIVNHTGVGVLMRPQIQPPPNLCVAPACTFVLPAINTLLYPIGATLKENSIFSNNGLGIDLNATNVIIYPVTTVMSDGPTPNDAMDVDNGPNRLQNYPVLTSAVKKNPSQVAISGTLDSAPGKEYRIEFFANKEADASGYGEGEKYIGSINVTTDANGHAAFTTPNLASSASRDVITATATDVATGDTSEFSAAITKQ